MAESYDRDRRLLACYTALRKVLLERLPIGIEIPDPHRKLKRIDTEASVRRAKDIISDMPADPRILGAIESLILDWLDALYMCRKYNRTREAIFGDLADQALTRFAETLAVLAAMEPEA